MRLSADEKLLRKRFKGTAVYWAYLSEYAWNSGNKRLAEKHWATCMKVLKRRQAELKLTEKDQWS